MKAYDMEHLDLKEAFSPTPQQCRDALAHTVRSVGEEKTMKRMSFRVALIAAIVLLAGIAVAFAAGRISLKDYFAGYKDVGMPETAVSVLADTEEKVYTLGPLSFTLRETLADGRIACATIQVAPTDGSNALINTDFYVIPDSEAVRLQVPEDAFFADAAKQAGIPLYRVYADLRVDAAYWGAGESMWDVLWAEDGSILIIHMLLTNPDTVPAELPGTLALYACEVDPETGEALENKEWQMETELAIPVSGVVDEKAYAVAGDSQIGNYTVQGAVAEQTCAGVYLTIDLHALDPVPSTAHMLYSLVELQYAKGNPLPDGIDLTTSVQDEDWPNIVMKQMLGMDHIPETIHVTSARDGSVIVLE